MAIEGAVMGWIGTYRADTYSRPDQHSHTYLLQRGRPEKPLRIPIAKFEQWNIRAQTFGK
jgi:hypothetical protein